MQESKKAEIKSLIAKNHILEAIDLLLTLPLSERVMNEVILISSNYHEAFRLMNTGLISLEDKGFLTNRLVFTLLAMLNDPKSLAFQANTDIVHEKMLFKDSTPSRTPLVIISKGKSEDPRLVLNGIESMESKLFLNFTYCVDTLGPNNGPNIHRNTFLTLNHTADKYYLETAINIPHAPFRGSFKQGTFVSFKLIFPKPYRQKITDIDLVELDALDGTLFSLLDIKLG